jgi:MFS transporter, UMF1 family
MEIKRKSLKEIFGWCMFDFANSSYTTVIISVVYCVVFSEIIVPKGSDVENPHQMGNQLWAWALAISYLLVVFTAPLIGAITDFSAKKKQFLFYTYILCVFFTASLWFVDKPGFIVLPFLLIIVSNYMFASSENIVSSFLPSLGPKEDLGKISGYAWGIGYFGGVGSLLFVTSVVGETKLENFEGLRLVGPATALFFLLSGIPTFLLLKEHTPAQKLLSNETFVGVGFKRLKETLNAIFHFRDLAIYLLSIFFAMAALSVVISFAFIYGSQEIKIEDIHTKVMFLFIQISAMIGAILFGIVQDKIGAKKTYNITLLIWVIGLFCIFWIKDLTNFVNSIGFSITIQWLFVITTSISGLCLGATQSASRAIVGLLAPESKSGEFFGLWGLSGKIASAIGLFLIGFLQTVFTLRYAFLAVAIFFVLSLLVSIFVNVERGMEAAKKFEEKI